MDKLLHKIYWKKRGKWDTIEIAGDVGFVIFGLSVISITIQYIVGG